MCRELAPLPIVTTLEDRHRRSNICNRFLNSEPKVSNRDFRHIADWLAHPRNYSHRPERVEIIETHISIVFLVGSFVYKLKRPVKYDFLDFTTLEARETACREEVRLNRRLAPGVYLGVVPVTRRSDGTLQIGGDGIVVDWLVQMRRLPTDARWMRSQQRGELQPDQIDELSNVLANFYRGLPPLAITPQEYRERLSAHVLGNRQELLAVSHHCAINAVKRIHGFQLQLLQLQPELLNERVRNGRVVEGHGDLRRNTFVSRILWRYSIVWSLVSIIGALTLSTSCVF